MRTRFKLYSEFLSSLKIAEMRPRLVIYCKGSNKGMFNTELLTSPHQLWNSEATKARVLVRLYVKHVLLKHQISKKIHRIDGYELLGKRCFYRDHIAVICNSQEEVDPDTGEVRVVIWIANESYHHPYKVSINEVQI